MRVMVTGGRDYADKEAVWRELGSTIVKSIFENGDPDFFLILGDATGADALALEWAKEHKIPYDIFYAKWTEQGLAAGPIRNQRMVDAKPDLCIAFPGNKGTRDATQRCVQAGVPVKKVT